jgi:hypothetical protein
MNVYNTLLNAIFIILGFYFIYKAYKKPDPIGSFNEKGYVAGGAFILLGMLSFLGQYSLLEIIKHLFTK